MAFLSTVTLNSFLVFSLTFSLLCPYNASQPTEPSASEEGSEGAPESSQMHVVAPTLKDCPNGCVILWDSILLRPEMYTNELSNVVFWFLPGTHNNSRGWKIEKFEERHPCRRERPHEQQQKCRRYDYHSMPRIFF